MNQAQEIVNIFGRLFCSAAQSKLYIRELFGNGELKEVDPFNAHEYLNGIRTMTLEQQEQAHELVELAIAEAPV